MKNIVVYKNHKLRDHMDATVYRGGDPYEIYTEMIELAITSAKKHLKGDWELVVFEDEYENYKEMIIEHHFRLRDMWKSEPCNILDMDTDTLFHKDIDFSKINAIKCLSMFGWTASVVYYPHEMSKTLWDKSDDLILGWTDWADEQEIYKEMMYSQQVRYRKANGDSFVGKYYPRTANIMYEGHEETLESLMESDIQQPLIHFHGTRDLAGRLAMMKWLSQQGKS